MNIKRAPLTITAKDLKEPPSVEFFREISDRFLYWHSRSEEECKNFADSYKKLMHALTSEVEV